MASPRVVVLGGPNGAGKSTFADVYFRDNPWLEHFVNADEIARGLSAFHPEKVAMEAGKMALKRIHKLAADNAIFAFETTLASRSFEPFLTRLIKNGYEVRVIYLWLSSVDAAIERVRDRVREGGHSIPEDVIHRRYWSGLRNFFELYRPLAFSWSFYDNSNLGVSKLIASGNREHSIEVFLPERWQQIEASLHGTH